MVLNAPEEACLFQRLLAQPRVDVGEPYPSNRLGQRRAVQMLDAPLRPISVRLLPQPRSTR